MNLQNLSLTIKQEGNLLKVSNNFDPSVFGSTSTSVILIEAQDDYIFVHRYGDADKFISLTNEDSVVITSLVLFDYTIDLQPVIGAYWAYADNVWERLATNYSLYPSDDNPDYRKLTLTEIKNLTVNDNEQVFATYIPVITYQDSSLSVTKVDDHSFTIESGIDYTDYEIKDYAGNVIESGDVNGNSFSYTFSEDGLYTVEFTLVDGETVVAEVYDLTDTEKCYLKLLLEVACNCEDCNNCEGKDYKRMLMIMNAYNFLRDYIYSERAVNMGIISEEAIRTDYVKVVGTLIEKLKVVTKTCSCD